MVIARFFKNYPIIKLNDVILHFVQSQSNDDAERAWENAKKNLSSSNYFIEAIADTSDFWRVVY